MRVTEVGGMSEKAERNTEIVKQYQDGTTLVALAAKYSISCQRIKQIVHAAKAWRRRPVRQEFLGVDVTTDTKLKLMEKAKREGTSMSALASDAIATMLEEK